MAGSQTHGARRLPRWLFFVLAVALVAAFSPFSPQTAAAETTTVYFESTGQTLGGPLYDVWESHGGRAQLGEPVSPIVETEGRWAQWFEYTRLDVTHSDPAQATEADIAPAPVGRQLADRLGFARWHPAFQPLRPRVGLGAHTFTTGHALVNGFLEMHQRPGVAERLGAPISREFGVNGTTYQFFEGGALQWTEQDGVRYAPVGLLGAAMHGDLRLGGERPEGMPVYQERHGLWGYPGERWIDVNLSSYLLTAYEGSTPVLQTYVVDGAWQTPTARGTFYIYWKLDSQTMRGRNIDGSEYITENVPYVMYFYADFALHGAWWRSSFGYSASHGCVNMPVGDAAWLYSWAGYGTRVEVHD
ncbi:MAG TPA: L,D-transpeptidase [Thermomicrobiales bacterium]|nr:L,D-transpeptidase [Thermomicrobiales bacterium]